MPAQYLASLRLVILPTFTFVINMPKDCKESHVCKADLDLITMTEREGLLIPRALSFWLSACRCAHLKETANWNGLLARWKMLVHWRSPANTNAQALIFFLASGRLRSTGKEKSFSARLLLLTLSEYICRALYRSQPQAHECGIMVNKWKVKNDFPAAL